MRGEERPRAGNGRTAYTRERAAGQNPDVATARDAPYRLSERELVVLRLLTDGLSDKQVALVLGVTSYTVNKHVGAILSKMQVRSRTAAAVAAIRQHLFEDEDSHAVDTTHHRSGRNGSRPSSRPGEPPL